MVLYSGAQYPRFPEKLRTQEALSQPELLRLLKISERVGQMLVP